MSIIHLMVNRHMFYVGEYRMLVQLPRNLETAFLGVSDKKVGDENFVAEKPRRY